MPGARRRGRRCVAARVGDAESGAAGVSSDDSGRAGAGALYPDLTLGSSFVAVVPPSEPRAERIAASDRHIVPRLRKVINCDDPGAITEGVGWKGGGFRFYHPVPSLLERDRWGNLVISCAAFRANADEFPDLTVRKFRRLS